MTRLVEIGGVSLCEIRRLPQVAVAYFVAMGVIMVVTYQSNPETSVKTITRLQSATGIGTNRQTSIPIIEMTGKLKSIVLLNRIENVSEIVIRVFKELCGCTVSLAITD